MQFFSYYLHPLLYLAYNMLYCFPWYISCFILLYLASQHVLQLFQHVSLLPHIFYCFDDVGLAFFGQDMPKYHVCTQIYMLRCFLTCLYLNLHVDMLFDMFMLRSICSCAFCHVMLRYMCSVPPCHVYAQIYMLVAMPCAFVAFYLLLCLFLMFWALGRMQIQILWSRPTSIRLGLHQRVWIISFMHVFACLLLCFRSMFVWLDLGSRYALCPPWACACWSLGPLARVVASVPLVAHQDVTTCKNTSS